MPRKPPDPVPTIVEPKRETLRRYGLSIEEWRGILRRQGGVCAICQRVPKSGRLVVDHHHAPKWKRMHPKKRRFFVRGLTCFICNGKCVSKHVTLAKARNVVAYLEAYEVRLAMDLDNWGVF